MALVVYELIRSTQAAFVQKWLLHTPSQPTLADDGFTAMGAWAGRMDGKILAPAAKDIRLHSVEGVMPLDGGGRPTRHLGDHPG